MTNIVDINKRKPYKRFHIEVSYMNDTSEIILATFFGNSLDMPSFLVFLDEDPNEEAKDDEANVPNILINSDNVKSVKIIKTEIVE